jgi:hypothetical protein
VRDEQETDSIDISTVDHPRHALGVYPVLLVATRSFGAKADDVVRDVVSVFGRGLCIAIPNLRR